MWSSDAREDAEHWFVRLRAADCSELERAAFTRWRAADPAHAAAYDDVANVWRQSVSLLQDPALAALRAEAHRMPAPQGKALRRSWAQGWAIAASLVIMVGAAVYGWRTMTAPPPPVQYATAIGEQRTLQLPDRSQVLLDTGSTLDVRFNRGERLVVLERGRAQFTVAHDAAKPFVVEAGRGRIRVLGTRFQVQQDESEAAVLLLEGAVSVTPPTAGGAPHSETLRPGEELVFNGAGQWHKRTPDLAFAQGWTHGDLIFNERPLGDLLAEANRYADVQLRLEPSSLHDLPISGVFHAGDQKALVLALEHGWRLRANQVSEHEIVLSR